MTHVDLGVSLILQDDVELREEHRRGKDDLPLGEMTARAKAAAPTVGYPRACHAIHTAIWRGGPPSAVCTLFLGMPQRSASWDFGINQEPGVPELSQWAGVVRTRVPDPLVHCLGVARHEDRSVFGDLPPAERKCALGSFPYDQGRDTKSQSLSVDGL